MWYRNERFYQDKLLSAIRSLFIRWKLHSWRHEFRCYDTHLRSEIYRLNSRVFSLCRICIKKNVQIFILTEIKEGVKMWIYLADLRGDTLENSHIDRLSLILFGNNFFKIKHAWKISQRKKFSEKKWNSKKVFT